jgi:predicted enzyme related to lactoylglutathione lyase
MTIILLEAVNLEQAMHKSKLGGFIIDCQTDDLRRAADFWSAALGMPQRELSGSEGEKYTRLDDSQHDLHIEVQKVEHPSRVHLDIETDDIEAEVARLEKLGARRDSASLAPARALFRTEPRDGHSSASLREAASWPAPTFVACLSHNGDRFDIVQ